MAVAKQAVVRRTRAVGRNARALELELEEPLGFSGGQYVIVDSGRVRPNGKAAKRAYSILSEDAGQTRLELVVKRIPDGPCSDFLHGLTAGDGMKFSGPWGKFVAPEAPAGSGAAPEQTLIVATDTGVTAALGLLRGTRFQPLLAAARLVWLRPGPEDFVSDAFVREHLPAGVGEFVSHTLPPVHHPDRLGRARSIVGELLAQGNVGRGFLCGDGTVNYGLLDDFAAQGASVGRDQLESFFNMPQRSASV